MKTRVLLPLIIDSGITLSSYGNGCLYLDFLFLIISILLFIVLKWVVCIWVLTLLFEVSIGFYFEGASTHNWA